MVESLPAISVIIPCYNVPEEYIRRAVGSIKNQIFTDYEVIIIDDGSDINYHNILQQLLQEEKVKLITQENGGVSRARNLGVEIARGSYIAFVDADDIISKSFLKEAYEIAIKTNADFVIGGTRIIPNFDNLPGSTQQTEIEYTIYQEDNIRVLFPLLGCLRQTIRFDNCYINRGPVARLLKREIARENQFHDDLSIGEDLVWNLEVLSKCKTVCIVNSLWYYYWKNPNSALHRFNPDMNIEASKFLKTISQIFNLADDKEFLTYHYLILDFLNVVRRATFEHQKNKDHKLLRKVYRSLNKDEPWILLNDPRFYKLAPRKYKILALLYRFHLLLIYWNVRTRISQSVNH